MSKNKLYNQSYFVKRLLDAGFFVKRLGIRFEDDEFRRWVIVVNDKDSTYNFNIFITCFKYIENDELKFTFKFQGQKEQEFIRDFEGFDVALHFGTLLAIGLFFFKDWIELIKGGFNLAVKKQKTTEGRMFWYIVLATIPGGIIGFILAL